MAYIGNLPEFQTYIVGTSKYTGDGACTQFTLTRDLEEANTVLVTVSGLTKLPSDDYSVSDGIITFTSPPSAAAPILVTYLATGAISFNQVSASQILAGQINETKLSSDAVSTTKIQNQNVTGAKLADNSIRGNNIVAGQITGNLLGLGAISANNFAGGGITSNVLSQNLTISVARVQETLNVNTEVIGSNSRINSNATLHVLNSTVFYFSSNTAGNLTFNITGNTTTRFDDVLLTGNTCSLIVTLRHNVSEGRAAVNVMIDGGLIQTTRSNPDIATGNIIFYAGNTRPTFTAFPIALYPATYLESNVIGINIFKRAPNSYFVLFSNTTYGLT